jgi:hypothetical protein
LCRAPVELPSDNIGTKMYAEIYCFPWSGLQFCEKIQFELNY